VPDFVIAYGWLSAAPWLSGYWGAVLVMTLGLYPLVYLPVAASLRSADPGQEEVARSLGLRPAAVFWRVTVRQARSALLGGCLLVSLALLAEYGAFEILRYQTFTTEIFTEFEVGFNAPAACALSLVLVVLGVFILGGEAALPDRGRTSRVGPMVARRGAKVHLGRSTAPVLLALTLLVAMALGLPVILFTAYTQFVSHRMATATPTYTPGGTPSLAGPSSRQRRCIQSHSSGCRLTYISRTSVQRCVKSRTASSVSARGGDTGCS